VAQQFAISYQTAHRLLRRLGDEGRLEVREKSGAFVPGGLPALVGVDLIFHPRATHRESFGSRLLGEKMMKGSPISSRSIGMLPKNISPKP
jgi:hypothetical protein